MAGKANKKGSGGKDYSRAFARVYAGVRVEKGLSQREVDRLMNRYPGWFSLLENEQYVVKAAEHFDICQALGADPVEVFLRVVNYKP